MEGTVKLPGAGEVPKKTLALVAVGGGVLVFVYIRRRNQSTASSTTVDSSTIDPATGFAYGTPEDAAALAGQSAYQNPTNYGGGGGPSGPSGTTVNPVATNDEWSRRSTAYLQSHGARFANVSEALSKYLAGEAVNADEKSLILQAIAYEGRPPVAGDAGYPPSIRETSAGTPRLRLGAPHVRVTHKEQHVVTLDWDKVLHADGYEIYKDGKPLESVDKSQAVVHRSGVFYVTARGANYYESKPSNFVHA